MIQTALVTGSAGFIGRHMVRELEERGWDVVGVDVQGDLLRPHDAHDVFRFSEKIFDLVVHCAYHVGGRAGIDGQNMNFAKNLQLDSAMFNWAVRTGQRRVLYFSSCAAYPAVHQAQVWARRLYEDLICLDLPEQWDECLPAAPHDNYGWAKLMGERMAADARRNGVPVTVVRPFSGYGEDQSMDYPFPAIVARAREGDLTVWGPPGQTRDWIHVEDVARGALAVVESETEDPVNLCTGVGTEMGELARSIQTQYYFGLTQSEFTNVGKVTYLEDKPYGTFYRVGDPMRLHQYYTPQISLEEGIRRALR